MNALASARAEMEKTVSELRIKRAKSSKIPPGAYRVFDPGELVLVYRERLDEWKTPIQLREWKENHLFQRRRHRESLFHHSCQKLCISRTVW
jgi:hypothetical protein